MLAASCEVRDEVTAQGSTTSLERGSPARERSLGTQHRTGVLGKCSKRTWGDEQNRALPSSPSWALSQPSSHSGRRPWQAGGRDPTTPCSVLSPLLDETACRAKSIWFFPTSGLCTKPLEPPCSRMRFLGPQPWAVSW